MFYYFNNSIYRNNTDNILNNSIISNSNISKKENNLIEENMLIFIALNKKTGEIKSFSKSNLTLFSENKEILKKILTYFLKHNINDTNKCYNFNTLYLSKIVIEGFIHNNFNYIFITIFNKNIKSIHRRLFILHLFFAYKNLYLKFCKILDNNENLFSLIFHEILIIPLIHNFDNTYNQLSKKIDLILFENSEYITSMLMDLESKEILFDIGNIFQKQYKSSNLQFNNRKEIIEELVFHGLNLKNNYLKSIDRKLDTITNSKKIELRATFPKPLFIIKFLPILQGTIIIHLFDQYKLSKIRKINPQFPNELIYDNYKEIDISYFNLFAEIEENNIYQINIIEKFFFEYFLLLGNNIKEIKLDNKSNSKIMTYKNRDYNLLYLNKEILKLMKNIIMEYFKDENDLIYKLKKKLKEENNNKELNEENFISKINITNNSDDNNNKDKKPLEFTYNNFINEFKSIEINTKLNNNDLIGLNNIFLPYNFSNIHEFSELNLTKDNLNIIKRNITTAYTENNDEFNIYRNESNLSNQNNLDKDENENDNNLNTNAPFISDATNIEYKADFSHEETGIKSILLKK